MKTSISPSQGKSRGGVKKPAGYRSNRLLLSDATRGIKKRSTREEGKNLLKKKRVALHRRERMRGEECHRDKGGEKNSEGFLNHLKGGTLPKEGLGGENTIWRFLGQKISINFLFERRVNKLGGILSSKVGGREAEIVGKSGNNDGKVAKKFLALNNRELRGRRTDPKSSPISILKKRF